MKHTVRLIGTLMALSAPLCALAESHANETTSADASTSKNADFTEDFSCSEVIYPLAPSAGKGIKPATNAEAKVNAALMARKLPYLHLIGKDNKFYVGIGGAVKGVASVDFGHVLHNANEFIVSAIPMTQEKGDGALYQVSAQQTELYLIVGFNPGTKYEVAAYVNGRFLGNNYGFQLENAHISFMGFTAGYGYGLFCDTWAAPTTIDYEGPNAMLAVTNGILDYRHSFGRWTVGAGIEMPMASFTTNGYVRKVNQRIPDVPFMVKYSLPGGGHLGASVILRGLQYRDLLKDKNRTVCGWGVRLSGAGTLFGPVGYCFQGAYGKGMNSYIQDISGMGLDLTPESSDGKMKAVEGYGLMGGLSCNISRTVSANASYSHVRVYPGEYSGAEESWESQYSYGQYAVANVMWQITPIVQCGLEYVYGRRVNINGQQAHDNRLQTMLQVSF